MLIESQRAHLLQLLFSSVFRSFYIIPTFGCSVALHQFRPGYPKKKNQLQNGRRRMWPSNSISKLGW